MPMGGTELLVILAVILLFFGAKRVPELARALGKGKHEFRRGIKEAEERDKAEARQDKDESPPSEGAHHEDGSVPEGEKPKAEPSSRA